MGKRVLIVGGVAGGASAAARIRRLDADASITIFERGEHVSFSNCSLPYYLSRTVADKDYLVLMTPEGFKSSYDIEVRVNSEVCMIDRTLRKYASKTAYQAGNTRRHMMNWCFRPDPTRSVRGPLREYFSLMCSQCAM